ncbi:MAG: allantoinase [Acidobacteriia bacterium]|nr:allantoinase [Terriglobia bacterium]
MEKKAIVYGIRMFDAEELDEVPEAYVMMKDGTTNTITMHLIEGSAEECKTQLLQSLDAFFELSE